jgi:hypothetical protein
MKIKTSLKAGPHTPPHDPVAGSVTQKGREG